MNENTYMNAKASTAAVESEASGVAGPTCRFCGHSLHVTFVDLGMSSLCQTHIEPHQLNHM